jgi:hypothetical protein
MNPGLTMLIVNSGAAGIAVGALLFARKTPGLTALWWLALAVNIFSVGLHVHWGGY